MKCGVPYKLRKRSLIYTGFKRLPKGTERGLVRAFVSGLRKRQEAQKP